MNPKKKIFEAVAVDLKTNDACVATWSGKTMLVKGKGEVRSPSLKNAQIK